MDWGARVRKVMPGTTGDARRDREIRDELAQHLSDRDADLREAGVDEAARMALLEQDLREAAAAHVQLQFDGRRWPAIVSGAAHDIRYGLRVLRRTPGFALTAIVTIALAIAATTAMVSVARGVLLRPLPFPEPDRIVRIWESSPQGVDHNVVSSGNYLDWRDQATSFDAIGAMTQLSDRAMTGHGEPRKVTAGLITPSILDVLRVRPAQGRAFTEADGAPNAPPAALLLHRFWQEAFGASADVVGQTIVLNGVSTAIAGVMPPDFTFPSPDADLLLNLRFDADDRGERRSHNYLVLGRLERGVALAAASAEMRTIAERAALEHPQFMKGWSVNVVPLHDDDVRLVRPLILAMAGVVVAVLLMACATLANLQLARAALRRHEMAVRAAIGAGRARLARQMLTEALLLAAAGGVLGIALGAASLPAIVSNAPPDIPFMERVGIDWLVLAAAAGVTLAVALATGTAPALRAGRSELRPALQSTDQRPDRTHQRLRQALLAVQVGIALVLVVSAALMARSFWILSQVSHGYDPNGVLTVELDLPRAQYGDLATHQRFYESVIERLESNPRVAAAAGTTAIPGSGAGMTFSFAIEGRPSSNPSGREAAVPLQGVTGDYFGAMRIPIVEGRGFSEADRADAPRVIVINESLAREHWPNGGAVGARINFRPGHMPWAEIVGIAGDTRDEGTATAAPPTIYVPFAQRASSWQWMTWQTLVVRARDGQAESLVPDVRATIRDIDPNLPLFEIESFERRLAEGEARRRMAGALIGGFALIALLLGTIGVYGVMSYTVSEQREEIGLRLALGARPAGVAAGLLRRALAWAGAGILLGLPVAALLTRSLEALLFEVTPLDPMAFVATSAFLLAVAALAAWVPARRAMRVDPMIALRGQ